MTEIDLAAEFPQRDGLIYLNHAAVAPWPRRSAEAVARLACENALQGAWDYRHWEATEARLRTRLKELIGAASAEDIALVKNTSEALSFVAYGLDWSPGDNVVTNDQEFPSNRWVWESLERLGVTTRCASIGGTSDPEAVILQQIDDDTRLVAVSSVQYGSGLRLDLPRLALGCRARGVLLCVDAIQSLGALRFDVAKTGADFVAADGHKWMLGPEGIGLFWVRPELRERLRPIEVGWRTAESIADYSQVDWQIARTARRFECGSPNMLGIHGLEASLSLLQEIGLEEVERIILRNTRYLIDNLAEIDCELLTPEAPGRHAGIVTFRHPAAPPAAIAAHLKAKEVLCAIRGGGVRLSPHFYTPRADLERALAHVREALRLA